MELFIESNILWTDELLNVRSEDYVAVNDTFIEVVRKTYFFTVVKFIVLSLLI